MNAFSTIPRESVATSEGPLILLFILVAIFIGLCGFTMRIAARRTHPRSMLLLMTAMTSFATLIILTAIATEGAPRPTAEANLILEDANIKMTESLWEDLSSLDEGEYLTVGDWVILCEDDGWRLVEDLDVPA